MCKFFFSMSISHFFFSRYILSKLASDCIPLFAFNLCSPLQLVHQERRGKFKMSQESECVIFKLPANSEHLVLRGGVRPRQWEPLSFPSTPRATAPPQGEQGGMCAFFKCVRVCLCVCVCVCVCGPTVFLLEWRLTGTATTHGATVIWIFLQSALKYSS